MKLIFLISEKKTFFYKIEKIYTSLKNTETVPLSLTHGHAHTHTHTHTHTYSNTPTYWEPEKKR